MSERLTAPPRSPIRRIEAKAKSPLRRPDAKTKLRSIGNHVDTQPPATTEAESLRQQMAVELEAADVEHDIAHLSPALQRFWQVLLCKLILSILEIIQCN